MVDAADGRITKFHSIWDDVRKWFSADELGIGLKDVLSFFKTFRTAYTLLMVCLLVYRVLMTA